MNTFLIKNGKVIDGTGNPWFKADLLIDSGKIKKIAPNIETNEVEEVNPRHILLILAPGAAEEQEVINRLTEIREKILSGEATFEDSAIKYSEDEDSKELGGKLKWQTHETLVQINKIPTFYTEAKKIKVGEISEPFKSSYGYHIITVDDYKPEHAISIIDDRSQIENVLYQEKTYRELERVLAELRAETYIDIRME